MAQPTAALSFGDLVLEVAHAGSFAYYGADGTEPAQVPVNAHDLAEAKRLANNAIRMFIGDAPPQGWRWLRPTREVVLWADLAQSPARTVTGGAYNAGDDETPVTANDAQFFPSMELHTLVIDGVGSFRVKRYVSATQVVVAGNASAAVADEYSIESEGRFTLPQDFSGVVHTQLTYVPAAEQFSSITWGSESHIRSLRSQSSLTTGPVYIATARPVGDEPRRWELLVYPNPDATRTVEMSYEIYFNRLDALTDFTPVPYIHDHVMRLACRAQVEADLDDTPDGPKYQRYLQALQHAYSADGRSAPRSLGRLKRLGVSTGLQALKDFREFQFRPVADISGF